MGKKPSNPEDEDNLEVDADWEPYKKACLDADAEEIQRALAGINLPICGTILH